MKRRRLPKETQLCVARKWKLVVGCRCEHELSGRRGTVEWIEHDRGKILIQHDEWNENPEADWYGYKDGWLELRNLGQHRRID